MKSALLLELQSRTEIPFVTGTAKPYEIPFTPGTASRLHSTSMSSV